jgi:hypothetical protein
VGTTDSFKEFFKIYLEQLSKEVFYSWLSPSGQFFLVKTNHGTWAKEYLKQLAQTGDIMNIMFAKGRFRITRYGDTAYCHNTLTKPSGKALKALIDSCIENNMQFLKWDNEDDDIVLWTNDEFNP